MTGKGTRKSVKTGYSSDRLDRAREFRTAAHLVMDYAPPEQAGNAVILNVVEAAIAYADTLSAAFAGQINRQDHAAAAKTLRSSLGNLLPRDQENALRKILGYKDSAAYGAKSLRRSEAESLIGMLDHFADWAEETLADRKS